MMTIVSTWNLVLLLNARFREYIVTKILLAIYLPKIQMFASINTDIHRTGKNVEPSKMQILAIASNERSSIAMHRIDHSLKCS